MGEEPMPRYIFTKQWLEHVLSLNQGASISVTGGFVFMSGRLRTTLAANGAGYILTTRLFQTRLINTCHAIASPNLISLGILVKKHRQLLLGEVSGRVAR